MADNRTADPTHAVHPDKREANPYLPEVAADPSPFYAKLRDTCPIANFEGMESGTHIISRYEDVKFALRHPEIFSSDFNGRHRPGPAAHPLQNRPARPRQYRRAMDPQLGPNQIVLEQDTRRLVNEIIDEFAAAGSCDFHAAFSVPLPCTVFLRITGLPLDQLGHFLTWKDNIIRPGGGFMGSREARRRCAPSVPRCASSSAMSSRAQTNPGDDVISRFIHAEIDGQKMSHTRSSTSATCSSSAGSTRSPPRSTAPSRTSPSTPASARRHRGRPLPGPLRRSRLLRLHTPVMQVIRVVQQEHEMHGTPCTRRPRHGDDRRPTPTLPSSGPTRTTWCWTARSTATWPSAVARTAASARTWPASSRGSLEELHRRIPDYAIADGGAGLLPGIGEMHAPAHLHRTGSGS
jgi:hypothetical protein